MQFRAGCIIPWGNLNVTRNNCPHLHPCLKRKHNPQIWSPIYHAPQHQQSLQQKIDLKMKSVEPIYNITYKRSQITCQKV